MEEKKKVLILTYYWPPSGGAGVQRWLKFAKYLPEYGIEPFILTVDPNYASYPQKDESLEKDINPELKIYKTKSFEPLNILSGLFGKKNVPYGGFTNVNKKSVFQTVLRFIRGNFFIPDARIGWNKYAFKKAVELIKDNNINTVITTGPPHSTHLTGLKLKKKININWITDFRDPWTDIYYYKDLLHTGIVKSIDKTKEKSVIKKSDIVIAVGNTLKKELDSKINAQKTKIITNGFDLEEFKYYNPINPERFTITYTGTLSDHYNIESFVLACSKLKNEGNDFCIRFIGSVSDSKLKHFSEAGLTDHIEIINYVPHQKSIEFLFNSSALLLVIPDFVGKEGIITGKMFEYLATGKPIIGIGPTGGDAAKIIEKCNAGKMIDYSDTEQLFQHLKLTLDTLKDSNADQEEIKKFDRKYLTKILSDLIQ